MQKILDEYKRKYKNFKILVKEGYEKYPLLRLFSGKQFIQLYEKAKNNKDNKDNISHLENSMPYILYLLFNYWKIFIKNNLIVIINKK